jgi:hypothetical protein
MVLDHPDDVASTGWSARVGRVVPKEVPQSRNAVRESVGLPFPAPAAGTTRSAGVIDPAFRVTLSRVRP